MLWTKDVAVIFEEGKIAKDPLRQVWSELEWTDLGNKPIYLLEFTFKKGMSWA